MSNISITQLNKFLKKCRNDPRKGQLCKIINGTSLTNNKWAIYYEKPFRSVILIEEPEKIYSISKCCLQIIDNDDLNENKYNKINY